MPRILAASISHPLGDATTAFAALDRKGARERLEDVARRAAEYESTEIHDAICRPGGNECEAGEHELRWAPCEIHSYGPSLMDLSDVLSDSELREHARALLRGETVALYC